MRLTLLLTGLFACVPLGILLCAWKRVFVYIFTFVMIASLLYPESAGVTLTSHAYYRGPTKGFDIHVFDLAALIVFAGILINSRHFRIQWVPPLTYFFVGMFALGLLSWATQSHEVSLALPQSLQDVILNQEWIWVERFQVGTYPIFELHKLLRGYVAFWLGVTLSSNEEGRRVVVYAVVFNCLWLMGRALIGRYIFGDVRVGAGMGHPNDLNSFLSMMGTFLVPFVYQRKSLPGSLLFGMGVLAALLVIVMTVSRSALAAYILSCALGVGISLFYFSSARNLVLTGLCVVLSLGVFAKAADTLMARFSTLTYSGSMEERDTYNRAAILMAKDYPLGVGPGNFVALSYVKYGELAGGYAGTPAHNIWWMTAAETGWIGMLLLLALWLRFFLLTIGGVLSRHISGSPELLATIIGAGLCTLPMQVQNLFHFSYRFAPIFLAMHLLMGVAVGAVLEARRLRASERGEEGGELLSTPLAATG